MKNSIRISASFGQSTDIVTVRMTGRSQPIVAGLLGMECGDDGKPNRLYLNCLIHKSNGDRVCYEGWEPSGAISTILTKLHPTQQG